MAAREFLWIVKESALGTVMSSPVAGTDSIYIRLADANSFGMIASPVIEEVPYGGGFAVTAESISDHYECKGQLKTKLYPGQAALLLGWAATRVDGAGAPWTTTEPVGDLASCSVYHAVMRSDGTYRRKRFAGCKVAGCKVDLSRKSPTAVLTLDLVAARSYGNAMDASSDPDATEFPAPAETDYPTGPYTFKMSGGYLSVGGSVRTQYESISIDIKNALDPRWFEQSYLSILPFLGRASTLDAELYLKATPDDRSAYEALVAQAASFGLHNGVTGQNLTITYNGKNTITALPYELPLNQAFLQKLSLKNRFDPAAAADIGISFA